MYIIYNGGGEVSKMQLAINSTEVRKNWSSFLDSVIRERPQVIKRNRDFIFALNESQLRQLVKEYTFKVLLEEDPEDQIWLAELEGFDLVAHGNNKEEALQDLLNQLWDYAHEYLQDFETMYTAPNRKNHFPYVLNILLHDSQEEIRDLLQCQVGGI
jgi:ribonucleotide monophosphatase NagD (HAD superfamily)